MPASASAVREVAKLHPVLSTWAVVVPSLSLRSTKQSGEKEDKKTLKRWNNFYSWSQQENLSLLFMR